MPDHPRRISKRGADLLRDPLLNKGAAFPAEERRAFGLDGLLPHRTVSMEVQCQRIRANLDRMADPLEKYVALAALQDRNEHLFFHLLCERIEELLPIVYTPTVGLATQRFSHVFQRGRGVWITPELRGRMKSVLQSAAGGRPIRLLVVTDNESILGIGDQGAGGIAISIGKLALYTAAAGIDPASVLPVSLDVGTENQSLLADPLYLGWPHHRLRGAAYLDLLDEFVDAVGAAFPGAVVQWEDFRKDNALRVLDRYRHRIASFNDDIQGTGALALAGILCAQRVTGRSLAEERVVIVGGGAAGLGIARQIRRGMQAAGLQDQEARRAIAVLDSKGLIVSDGSLADAYKEELAWSPETARDAGLGADQRTLADVAAALRPTVLIGTSGQSGGFAKPVLQALAARVHRPLIMPLSNPNTNAEAVPEDVYAWTGGQALVASGSPFPDVTFAGRSYRVGQGNNAFIFPAVGLAALSAGLRVIPDEIFLEAARGLANAVTDEELAAGLVFPPPRRLREVSLQLAERLLATFAAGGQQGPTPAERIAERVWQPVYQAYLPAGDPP